jgi:hypothetical protein
MFVMHPAWAMFGGRRCFLSVASRQRVLGVRGDTTGGPSGENDDGGGHNRFSHGALLQRGGEWLPNVARASPLGDEMQSSST